LVVLECSYEAAFHWRWTGPDRGVGL